MLIRAMSAMMERMGPMTIHHVGTTPSGQGQALVDRVYEQMRRDFFVASPFMLHAGVPELLAGTWSLVRETLFSGQLLRSEKENIAEAVSAANACPFCVGAHHAAVVAAGGPMEAIQTWAKATHRADDPALVSPPFTSHRAEYVGTVVAFHYLNRMVSVFLDSKMMPTPSFMDVVTAAMAKTMMGGMIEKGKRNQPGDSLPLLPDHDRALAWQPPWAEEEPHIAGALAGWSALTEGAARKHLDEALLANVAPVFDAWTGGPLPAEGLGPLRPTVAPEHQPIVDLALLTVMAPHKVDDARTEAAMKAGLSETQVLSWVAWAAQRAARRVGTWTFAALPSSLA